MPPTTRLPSWMNAGLALIRRWLARSRQRHDLAMLNDDALRDIGLTRSDVQREIAKPFWQL